MDLLLGVRGRLLLRGVSEGVCAGAVRGRRRGRGGHGEYPGRLLLLLLRLAPGSRSQVRRVLPWRLLRSLRLLCQVLQPPFFLLISHVVLSSLSLSLFLVPLFAFKFMATSLGIFLFSLFALLFNVWMFLLFSLFCTLCYLS